jgi:hypothetical protein
MDKIALALIFLTILPMAGRGALVTRVVPIQEPVEPPASPAAVSELASANPCDVASGTIYALENSIIETEAQLWAYNMRKRDFLAWRRSQKLDAKFTYSRTKSLFYKRLAAWYRMDVVPEPAPEALERIRKISISIHLVRNMRGPRGVLGCQGEPQFVSRN